MRLPWRFAHVGDRPILSSITDKEIARLTAPAGVGIRVLEIGSAYGYSACSMAMKGSSVITIDPHQGYGALDNSLEGLLGNIEALDLYDRIIPIVSKSKYVLPRLRGVGMRFDVVFIDGDHRYEAVRQDLLYGWMLLHTGGILAVHDYGEETCPDVRLAIDKMIDDYTIKGHELTDTLWTTVKR